jgi:N-acetylmuramoyl-L-alanine amidase
MTTLRGKVSWFGGPEDTGVSPSEGLAFYYSVADAPELFLPTQPSGTTGLARRLDPDTFYIACRWDYAITPKTMLPDMTVKITNPKTGATAYAVPGDWGPHIDTGRCADLSPGLMSALELTTDDEVIVEYEPLGVTAMPTYSSIVISSGHGLHVRGAHGILDEVDEARRVVDRLKVELEARGVKVDTFHDNTSTSQNQNLQTITNHHNSKTRDLDVSIHFNAFEQTAKPMGTECLYVTQTALAADISSAIADCGFINRGAKKRTDLYFLNHTNKPAILIETCFVDSEGDASLYRQSFDAVCSAIADVLGGALDEEEVVPPPVDETHPPTRPIRPPVPAGRIDIAISGDVTVTINGVVVWP